MKYNRIIYIVPTVALAGTLLAFGNPNYFALVKNIDLFAELYRKVNEAYVDNTEPSKLMKSGIDAMLKSLDPYTNYYSEGQIEEARLNQNEQTADIGADFIKNNDKIVVSEVYEDLPAFKAGIQVGDIITAIDGVSTQKRSAEDVSRVLQGQPGSNVALSIQRQNNPQTITVARAKEPPKSVPHFGMIDGATGYIKLSSFLRPGCTEEVTKAVTSLKEEGMKNLVFDLRHNGGGLLNEAITMVNIFVDKDELVTVTKGKTQEWQKEYKTPNGAVDKDIPLVVLVDEKSASASEIFSGAMQDLDRGVILGQRTFGKGLVQQTKDIGYNAKMKLTVAKYFLPSGRCVQAVDYSGRYKDGATTMPDSLRKAFNTRNNRKVFDGSGVEPDVAMDKKNNPPLMDALKKQYLIFDYATQYHAKNSKIASAKDFTLADTDFDNFVQYLDTRKFDYDTETQDVLEKLKAAAEVEKYDAALEKNIASLEAKIKVEKKKELQRHKKEIIDELNAEIVRRYYYQKGKVEASLNKDENIKKALTLLADPTAYTNILSGKK